MIIKPYDKTRVLRWFKSEHPEAFPHVKLMEVKSVTLQNRMIERQPAQRVVIIFGGLVAGGRTSNFPWLDQSADAPAYMTDLDQFWRHISEYLWEDTLAFDDLYKYVIEQHGLTAIEEMHNAVHYTIEQATKQGYTSVDLSKIYRRFRGRMESDGYDDNAFNRVIVEIEAALEDAKIPVLDHVVQLEIIQ